MIQCMLRGEPHSLLGCMMWVSQKSRSNCILNSHLGVKPGSAGRGSRKKVFSQTFMNILFVALWCNNCLAGLPMILTIAHLFYMYCRNFPFVTCILSWLLINGHVLSLLLVFVTIAHLLPLYCKDCPNVLCILLLLSICCPNLVIIAASILWLLPICSLHIVTIAHVLSLYCLDF